MATSSDLEKPKEREYGSTDTILETIWAPVIAIPTSSVPTLQRLCEAVQEDNPIAKQSSVKSSQPPKAPVFLLQKLRYKNINRRFESRLLMSFEEAQQYQDLDVPSVLPKTAQSAETPRIAVHLRSDQAILKAMDIRRKDWSGQKRYMPLDYEGELVNEVEQHEW